MDTLKEEGDRYRSPCLCVFRDESTQLTRMSLTMSTKRSYVLIHYNHLFNIVGQMLILGM
jgi:hypothetical protein